MFLVHSHICILVMNVGIMLIEFLQVYVKQKCEKLSQSKDKSCTLYTHKCCAFIYVKIYEIV